MIHKIFFIIVATIVVLNSGCSTLGKLPYYPDLNQGNYFMPDDIFRIYEGMKKSQVIHILGSPIMSDPFGTDTWFYIFRQQLGRKRVTQQVLTLTFNNDDVLTNIKYEPSLSK